MCVSLTSNLPGCCLVGRDLCVSVYVCVPDRRFASMQSGRQGLVCECATTLYTITHDFAHLYMYKLLASSCTLEVFVLHCAEEKAMFPAI